MARIDAFELSKNNARTNERDWFLDTPILSYGIVVEVIDIQTVVVEAVVQTTLAKEVYTVSLLSLSSQLYEQAVMPKLDDLVLLLFLQHKHQRMFEDPARRAAGGEERTIYDRDAAGYNRFSGVGMLVTTVKAAAATTIRHEMEGEIPAITARTGARLTAEFNRALALTFNVIPVDSDEEPEPEPIDVTFGSKSPLDIEYWAAVKRVHGMMRKGNGEQVELDAPVEETYSIYSPVTKDIQGKQTTGVGLGKDKDDKPVETEASITETVHGKAPITRDIRSPQTLTVGIGNAESEDDAEEREAPVNETYGSKSPITKDIRSAQKYIIGTGPDGPTDAPVDIELDEKSNITLTSKSGMTAHFDKAVFLDGKEGLDLAFKGAVAFSGDDDVSIEFKGAGTFASTAGSLLKIGNSVATLGGMIADLLTALTNLATEGSPGAAAFLRSMPGRFRQAYLSEREQEV